MDSKYISNLIHKNKSREADLNFGGLYARKFTMASKLRKTPLFPVISDEEFLSKSTKQKGHVS